MLKGADILLNSGPAGVQMVPKSAWLKHDTLKIAVDLNAAPPLGIEGIEVNDAGVLRDGIRCFGAFGIGNFKTKLHKACVARLFTKNDLVLATEAIADVARETLGRVEGLGSMPRVVGIDPGTVSIDVCGLSGAELVIDRFVADRQALADRPGFAAALSVHGAPELVAGLSGYGLPLRRAAETSDHDLRLAFLARKGEQGGIGGLRQLARALADGGIPAGDVPGRHPPRHRS